MTLKSLRNFLLFGLLLVAKTAVAAPEPTDVRAFDMAADKKGRLFSVGHIYPELQVQKWIVRRSTNQGKSWELIDLQKDGKPWLGQARAVAIDSSDRIFVAGASIGQFGFLWTVKSSSDKGATWVESDLFKGHENAYFSEALDIDVDSKGTIWVAGYSQISFSAVLWQVRKSSDAGKTWVTADEFLVLPENAPRAIKVDQKGGIFVGGNTKLGWTLRRSLDDGKTWATIETLKNPKSSITSIGLTAEGNLLVSGWIQPGANLGRWTVFREGRDSGNSWLTLHEFAAGSEGTWSTTPTKIIGGLNSGEILASGFAESPDKKEFAGYIQKSVDGGNTWSLQLLPDAALMGILPAQNSRLFVYGAIEVSKPVTKWTTWLSLNGGESWNTSDTFEGK